MAPSASSKGIGQLWRSLHVMRVQPHEQSSQVCDYFLQVSLDESVDARMPCGKAKAGMKLLDMVCG